MMMMKSYKLVRDQLSSRLFTRQYQTFYGLLTNRENIKKTLSYTTTLDIQKSTEFLSHHDLLYKQALKDVSNNPKLVHPYLERIYQHATTFIQSDEIWNHNEVKGTLNELLITDGHFICMKGVKNSGKSKILSTFEKENMKKVFYVNMRKYPNFFDGLLQVIQRHYLQDSKSSNPLNPSTYSNSIFDGMRQIIQSRYQYLKKLFFPTRHTALQLSSAAMDLFTGGKTSQVVNKLPIATSPTDDSSDQEKEVGQITFLHSLLRQLISELGNITIIIDEANYLFSFQNPHRQMENLFNYFITLTKHIKHVNIVLCSNDDLNFPFPYQPFSPKSQSSDHLHLPFDFQYFTSYLFCGEHSPKDIYYLLINHWKVGENLALSLIDLYGGNIYHLYHVIYHFKRHPEKFQPYQSYQSINLMNIFYYFSENEMNKNDFMKILRSLAKIGFYPLEDGQSYYHPVIHFLLAQRIVNLIHRGNDVIMNETLEKTWENIDTITEITKTYKTPIHFGIIPASQSLRLSIALWLNSVDQQGKIK